MRQTNGWHKAAASSGGGQCMEVKKDGDLFLVRNSKAPHAGTVTFTAQEWAAAKSGFVNGEFDADALV